MNQSCRNVGKSLSLAAIALLGFAGAALAADSSSGKLQGGGVRVLPASVNPDAFDGPMAAGSPFAPRVPGCLPTSNCQEYGTTATNGRSSCVSYSANTFVCADNFSLPGTGTQTINQICFWSYFGLGTGGTATVPGSDQPQPGAEAYRIRILANVAGKPDTTAPIATIFSGANADTTISGFTGTYTGTLTRGASAGASPLGAASPVYLYTVTGLNVSVPANTCFWVEIGGATANANANNRTRLANHSAAAQSTGSDGLIYQYQNVNGVYAYTDLVSSVVASGTNADRAICIGTVQGGTINTAPAACNIPPAPTNATCATATNVTAFPFTEVNTNTLRATNAATPFCGANPVNGTTIWYKVTGNGTTITADTCGPNTGFDTVINVYCGTACGTGNAGLNCVANNDTGPVTCTGGAGSDPSSVSFIATTGNTYWIAIYGFQITAGFLDVTITSDGIQAANPPACVSDRCPVDISAIPAANLETDACGVSTNSAALCNGGTGKSFLLGVPFAGTMYNLGNTRDFDFWEYDATNGGALPDNSGGAGSCFLQVSYRVEFPGLFNFFTGTCAANNGTFIPTAGANTDYRSGGPACPHAPTIVNVTTPAGQPFRINLLTVDFGGVPCATGNNNYILSVSLAPTGSCCQPNTNCQVTTQASCSLQAGFVFSLNGTCSPVDACSGVCCTGTACAASASTDCVGAGTTFFAGGTCTPTPCVTPGVCCRGATCTTTITTAGACTVGSGTAGAFFATGGSACNSGNVSSTPCCYANYNKVGGVTVTDIFNFLSDWFAASPYARTGGNGDATPLSVQNIFDFLTNWFNGCNP